MKPSDTALYNYVKSLANKKFKSPTGIYRSSWIIKEYKKRGGKFVGKKGSNKSPGLKRWFSEKWVDLNRPIKKNGKIIGYKPCGRKSSNIKGKYPLCRPSKRITSKTPKTFKELSKKRIQKAKKAKSKVTYKSNIKFGGKSKVKRKPNKLKSTRKLSTKKPKKNSPKISKKR